MAKTTVDISMFLDGFIAGPNQTVEEPLGRGGLQLHQWLFATATWRERHGEAGGEEGPGADACRRLANGDPPEIPRHLL